ncbi:carbamoyltransferase HypF [Streptomyces sp. TRM49041]|uniref:carbamoyltransferase HypF n=1 Tax=Streptomyces sp. TRM49041 TaxID=2603216 RepID=UPI0021CD0E42|nr:carbamoyltransferase HypF [Streptomyces sp. TRM49041]
MTPARPDVAAEARAAVPGTLRRRVTVEGVVQGVGFRPYVQRLATEHALVGHVSNTASGVLIEVAGDAAAVARFCDRLGERLPPLARLTAVRYEDLPTAGEADGGSDSGADSGFTIRPSGPGGGRAAPLPPDTATCDACLRELTDPADRRHRHPFITCTNCGPRFTIVTALPYDRATTTMAGFPMCAACAAEYRDPGDRRFHAQPVACPDCGPRLRLVPAAGSGHAPAEGPDAVAAARRLLARGGILAVKGIGGYHLACDATDAGAVAALRARKARGGKPFAVMCADAETAARFAAVSPAEHAVLTGPLRPIVLLRRRAGSGSGLPAPEVCPGSPHVGVLLPYAPVHRLLFGLPGDPPGPQVLVMTSGNRSGEPIVTDDGEALTRLAGLADAWLAHDRPIEAPCDDSVVRVRPDGTELVLRRSRGYVPRPLPVPVPVRSALAVGGDLKNTLCLGAGQDAWFSPHIGDMGDLATLDAFARNERRLRHLTGVEPRLVVADLHPAYHSAHWARRRAEGPRLRLVQHHHAHIASAMAEHGLDGTTPVIGVAFDGTGYGEDGTVWGGEFLLADYVGYRRFAHLAPAPLPGGDAGVANPCRTALARLRAARLPWDRDVPSAVACSAAELTLLDRQLERGTACVATSSAGRLFDAVSSLAGVCHRAGYEAQAALELEARAATAWADTPDSYGFAVGTPGGGGPLLLDPAPVLGGVVRDVRRGTPAGVVAARFHRGLAVAVADMCGRARRATGLGTVVLTGGVFANALLEEECAARLAQDGFTVLRHGEVPPGDGGLALGQLLVAAREETGGR